MATIAIMLGGAILNAGAFIGGSYIVKSLSGSDNSDAEQKRHDLALEKYNNDLVEYQKKKKAFEDWEYEREKSKKEGGSDFQTTDEELKYYNSTHRNSVNSVGNDDDEMKDWPVPVFSDYYQPGEDQKKGELLFVGGGMLAIGYLVSKFI